MHPTHSPARLLRLRFLAIVCSAIAFARGFAQAPPDVSGCLQAGAVRELSGSGSGFGGLCAAPGGGVAYYLDGDIVLRRDDGSSAEVLASFDPATFGSFLVLAPTGEGFVFGENTSGNIYALGAVAGEPVEHVDTLAFNYSLVFDAAGNGLVSAPSPAGPNQISLLDDDPTNENQVLIANIPGFSGPLALGEGGDLYYALADLSLASQSIHRFTRQQIEDAVSGVVTEFEEGEVVAVDVPGLFELTWAEGILYGSDLGFAGDQGQVLAFDPAAGFSSAVVARFPSEDGRLISPSYLAFVPGSDAFRCGAGRHGGELVVAYSDFGSRRALVSLGYELHFVRGRLNADETVDFADAGTLLAYLFAGGTTAGPIEAADINDDGEIDVSDPIYLLDYLFLGGPEPPPPFAEIGPDPTA